MPALSPEQLISNGPNTSPEEIHTKIESAEPTRINLDQLEKQDKEVADKSEVIPEDKPFDINEFKPGTTKPIEPVVKKEAEVKKEEVPIEKKEEDLPFTAKGVKPKPKLEEQLKEEDLKDLSEEELIHFKKMDKTARQWVKQKLEENKKLQGDIKTYNESKDKIPPNWFEQEDGYILHRNYKEAYKNISESKGLAQFWVNQFTKVRAGEKWHQPILDDKGNIQYIEREPGTQAEVYLQQEIQREQINIAKEQEKLTYIANNFKTLKNQAVINLKSLENKFFPQYAEEKSYSDKVEGVRKSLGNMGLESNVLSGFLLKLYAHSQEQDEYIKELESKIEKKAIIKEQRLKAGPNVGELSGEQTKVITNPLDKPFSMDDFKKAKESLYV